jgi:hypothetical protein
MNDQEKHLMKKKAFKIYYNVMYRLLPFCWKVTKICSMFLNLWLLFKIFQVLSYIAYIMSYRLL